MLTYKQAGEIRRKYPESLNRQNIDDIIREWDEGGIERVDMLVFSVMFDPDSDKLSISEMELFLRGTSHFNFKDLQPISGRSYFGPTAVAHFENLTEYRSPYEVEKETYDLRFEIGKEFLDKCKSLDAKELSDSFKEVNGIRKEIQKRYRHSLHPWQVRLNKLTNLYI